MWASLRAKSLLDKIIVAVGESSWLLLCFVAVTMLLAALLSVLPESDRRFMSSSLGQLLGGLLVYSFACVFVILPLWLVRGRDAILRTLGIDKAPSFRYIASAVPAWILYMAATIVVGFIVMRLMPWIDGRQTQQVGFHDINTSIEYVIAFIALVVLPPIAEELMFRGYLFGRLRTRFKFLTSSVLVSLLFGLVHQQWNVSIDTFVLSMFLCYLRESTGMIWPSMVLHGLKNSVAYVLIFIAPLMGWNLVQ